MAPLLDCGNKYKSMDTNKKILMVREAHEGSGRCAIWKGIPVSEENKGVTVISVCLVGSRNMQVTLLAT